MSVMMSASGLAVAAAVAAPLVIEAGLTPATAATAGSMNCASRNWAIPATMSARTSASADGFDSRTSSSVSTMMPAALVTARVSALNASLVTGLGLASPTHPYVPPAVWLGTFVLNGTWRRFAILPRMVFGRKYSMKSAEMVWFTSGPAQVLSVVLPAATAAFRCNATSGVLSSQRLAYSAASYLLPWQVSSAQAVRTKAVPAGTFALTV